jgi:endoglycosylceramidase
MFYRFRRFQLILVLLFTAAALSGSQATASGLLHTDGPYFKDLTGRPVMLHGINLSNAAKVPPFNPLQDLSQLKRLRDLGFNNIRLLFIWEAFEPQRGQYNYDYLEQLAQLIQAASALGIYTVLDFHMDGFSRYTIGGCGSGAPLWTVPRPDTIHPGDEFFCRIWAFFGALEYAVPFSGFDGALDDFYSDKNGVRTEFLNVWSMIARYFKNYPMLVGYDMLNEPWGDEKNDISPLYEDIAKTIRTQDPEAVLFVEPFVMDVLGWLPTRLVQPTFGNFAYASHNYDSLALGASIWIDGPIWIDTNFSRIQNLSRKWNAPVYIGEFGVAGSGGIGLKTLLRHYYNLYDEHFTSSAQWDYSPDFTSQKGDGWNYENMSIIDQDGNLRRNFIPRPYVSAVSGTPGKMKAELGDDSKKRALEFEWVHDPALGSTDFFIPPALYPDPSQVSFTPGSSDVHCAFNSDTSTLNCRSEVPGQKSIKILGPGEN